jgi:hypothetical protein
LSKKTTEFWDSSLEILAVAQTVTGLACSVHSEAQHGVAAEFGLR